MDSLAAHLPQRMKSRTTAKATLRMHREEPLAREIRNVARGQIDAVCRVLEGSEDSCRAVHEARKSLKKLRAILRLVASEFSREQYQLEKRAYQEAARLLAPLRDAEVRVLTLDTLIQGAELDPADFAQLRGELQADTERLAHRLTRPKHRAVEILRTARRRIPRWPVRHLEWKPLEREIRRTYQKGRKALRRYQQEPTPECFHAWRKRVKELWYHLRITEKFLPEAVTKAIAPCEKIGELAGEAQDLAVLRETLSARNAGAENALLIGEIEVRLPEIYRSAVERGTSLYTEKPRDFMKRGCQR